MNGEFLLSGLITFLFGLIYSCIQKPDNKESEELRKQLRLIMDINLGAKLVDKLWSVGFLEPHCFLTNN